jgi:hypothetical protein
VVILLISRSALSPSNMFIKLGCICMCYYRDKYTCVFVSICVVLRMCFFILHSEFSQS